MMIDLPYDLTIEATGDPAFFGFYSSGLLGFSGIGHSVEDCHYKAKWGMQEHLELMREQNLSVPPVNTDPQILIQNSREETAA